MGERTLGLGEIAEGDVLAACLESLPHLQHHGVLLGLAVWFSDFHSKTSMIVPFFAFMA